VRNHKKRMLKNNKQYLSVQNSSIPHDFHCPIVAMWFDLVEKLIL
jgi:hypothetical protein